MNNTQGSLSLMFHRPSFGQTKMDLADLDRFVKRHLLKAKFRHCSSPTGGIQAVVIDIILKFTSMDRNKLHVLSYYTGGWGLCKSQK